MNFGRYLYPLHIINFPPSSINAPHKTAHTFYRPHTNNNKKLILLPISMDSNNNNKNPTDTKPWLKWLLLALCCVNHFSSYIGYYFPTVLEPQIIRDLGL